MIMIVICYDGDYYNDYNGVGDLDRQNICDDGCIVIMIAIMKVMVVMILITNTFVIVIMMKVLMVIIIMIIMVLAIVIARIFVIEGLF